MKTGILLICLLTLSSLSTPEMLSTEDMASLNEWKMFYQKNFGINLALNELDIPPYKVGYDRILIIAGGLTYEKIILTMRKEFDVIFVNKYLPGYFDHNLINKRNNNITYAIRVKNNPESGETNPGSATLEKISREAPELPVLNEMTLKERLIFEMKYHEETSAHLDMETFTVCAGSHFRRDSLALAPAVGWKNGIDEYFPPFLYISECYDIYTIDGMYSRNVVSGE